ncbi:MAG: D-alanyl-D-alanine endopeptidase [Comamonadaceae bacterium]|nr:D-alanyl-D-alanine endopeptidase [Comamonadaceae bacterium]
MTTYLIRSSAAKLRTLIGFLSLLVAISLSLTSVAQAGNKRTHVDKSKKVAVVQGKRIAVSGKTLKRRGTIQKVVVASKPSYGQLAGLHTGSDDLNLKSSVALIVDQETSEVLFSKNDKAILPIASLTKLMTGLVVSEANLPLDEMITVSQEDVDTERGSSSRLHVGSVLSRGELLHLALMSSENRAAHALARTYPGGMTVFTSLMNAKAKVLGMKDTRYVEPTGLSSSNQSSARDLVKLVNVAHGHPLLRELTTSHSYQLEVGKRTLQYNNTNRLVKNPSWDIGLQKTGYISEAGQCLVMQAKVAGRKLIMVFLDSAGKLSRIGDAERVRQWVESATGVAEGAPN